MEIILSEQCESLTGTLGRGFGYYIKVHRSTTGKTALFSRNDPNTPSPRTDIGR